MGDSPAAPGHGFVDIELKEIQTRFLFPFFYDRHSVVAARDALLSGEVARHSGVWSSELPPSLYSSELIDHVRDFLFPDSEAQGLRDCAYLRFSSSSTNRFFQGIEVSLDGLEPIPIKLVSSSGVELFLTDQGVGVFCISLMREHVSISTAEALQFNYLIASRLHSGRGATFRRSHPADDPARWNAIPEETRAKIAPPPSVEAPIDERLGTPGGAFGVEELLEECLRALHTHGFRPVQRVLSVYTVGLCKDEVDLEDLSTRRVLGPFLAGLAQVEEPNHAGATSDIQGLPNAILNRCHWAAVGMLGSAHIIADQSPDAEGREIAFNQQRMPRVRDKYFVPFLLAMLQRLALQRALNDASEIVSHKDRRTSAARFRQLRTDLMEFGVDGHFPQVSSRHAVHRYYKLARSGLDIGDYWDEVRRAIGDLESSYASENQERMTAGMAKSLVQGVHLQEMIHVIEVFLVSVYSADLTRILLEQVHPLLKRHPAAETLLSELSPVLVILAAATGFLVTWRWVHRARTRAEVKDG